MKKIIGLFLASLLVLTSCEDDLDINTNPNTPEQINKGLALSAAEGSIATVVGGDLFNLGGMLAQYYTQAPSAGQYEAIDEYNMATDYANRLWSELYAGALNGLQFVKNESMEEGDTGTFLIATVLQAYTFQYLVDIFGDVPYTDALQGNENISPAPTPGQEIYADLLVKLNEALAAYENDPVDSNVAGQDLIYNANMENWVRFANTLKLKLYLRMAYTSQANPSAVMELINEGNFIQENAAFAAFGEAIDKRNPFYEVQIDYLGNVNTVASNSLIEFYLRNEDPRVQEVFTTNDDGEYVGIDQGEGLLPDLGGTQANEYSRPDIGPTHPVYLMSVPESKFLQAEALLRYGDGTGVEELYNEGIAASFELYEAVDENDVLADPSEFTGEGGIYEYTSSGAVEQDLEQIIVQKWAALANLNNVEAWIETKRTGYPQLVDPEEPAYEEGRRIISLGSILPGGQIPYSLFYPDTEVQRNTNLTQKENLLEKVWWNQNN